MRTTAIWVMGLLGSGTAGGLIGSALLYGDGGVFGFIGGLCLFACIRLWAKENNHNSN